MTPLRIELLDSIGFDWGGRRGEAAWTLRYDELCEYYEATGRSNFPTRSAENRALGRWVTEQRRLYRQMQGGTLVGDDLELFRQRIPLLERIRFVWAMQGREGEDDDEGPAQGQDADDNDTGQG
jgi:hypothetical protein